MDNLRPTSPTRDPHANSLKRPSSPSPPPSSSKSNTSKKPRSSTDPDIKYLKSPKKSTVDKNNYRLIELSNGIIALLISDRHGGRIPHWQNRQINTLGFTGYAPGPGSPFCPVSNGLQNLQNVISPIKNPHPFLYNSLLYEEEFTPGKKLSQPQATLLGCSKGERHPGPIPDQDTGTGINDLPFVDEAAFALSVNVGSSNDPDSHNGIAHFCEHMLHYGSLKYQKEDAFFKFAMEKGKGANAFTQAMSTTYHFSVTTKYFQKGLDIVSNMVASPLFNLDCIEREVHAVDNEFMLKEHVDVLKAFHIIWSTAAEDHPLNSFPCGNLKTLLHPEDPSGSTKLEKALRSFHKKHYVGSAMTLAVQSSLSLDDLEELVVDHFSKIPKGNRSIRRLNNVSQDLKSPYDTPEFQRMYTVQGNDSKILLIISWPLPPEAWQDWKNKPLEFLELLMNEEWEGGLSHNLRQKGWIIDWSVGAVGGEITKNEYTTLFQIFAELTPTGIANLPKVVESIYSFIKRIQEIPQMNKVQLWKELTKTCDQYFNYSAPGHATTLTVFAARRLQVVPGEDIFISDACLDKEFNNEAFNLYLNMLKPSRMNLMVIMPKHIQPNNSATKFDLVEPYTKGRYNVTNFCLKFMKKLESVTPFETFTSLPGNPYTPTLSFVPDQGNIDQKELRNNDRAIVIHEGNFSSSSSSAFKAKISVTLISPLTKSNPRNEVLLCIWGGCLRNSILTRASAMKRAGLEVSLQAANGFLKFELTGFPELLTKAMEIILFISLNSREQLISEQAFNNVKASVSNSFDSLLGNTLHLAKLFQTEIMTADQPSFNENINSLQSIHYNDLLNFVELFKSSSFGLVTVSGNISIKDGLRMAEIMELLDYSPDVGNWRGVLEPSHKISLPPGERCLRMRSTNRSGVNTALMNCYQVTPYDSDINVKEAVDFIAHYIQAPAFQLLRTERQLGYIVSCGAYTCEGSPPGLILLVVFQSTNFSACHVDQQMDMFLSEFYHRYLKHLTDVDFSEQQKMLDLSRELRKEGVIKWYERTFLNAMTLQDGKVSWKESCGNVAKLSIQVLGCDEEQCKEFERCGTSLWEDSKEKVPRVIFAKDSQEHGDNPYFIHDVKDFRDSRVR